MHLFVHVLYNKCFKDKLHEEQLDAAENARAVIFSHFTFLREKIDL
jgi:hypothetical protein